ncbi:MAG: hypothetical protein HEQ23_07190 [Tepidisphaera sp.]
MARGKHRIQLGTVLLAFGVAVAGVTALSRWRWVHVSVRSDVLTGEAGLERGEIWFNGGVPSLPSGEKPSYKIHNLAPAEPSFVWRLPPPYPPIGSRSDESLEFGLLRLAYVRVTDKTAVGQVVLWPFATSILASAFFVRRAGVRARLHAAKVSCLACGYDLRSTPSAKLCPECGEASSQSRGLQP